MEEVIVWAFRIVLLIMSVVIPIGLFHVLKDVDIHIHSR